MGHYQNVCFQDYFSKFGYLQGPSSETGNLMSKEDFPIAIRNFQKFGNIPVTGILDQRTKELLQKPRCGNKDTIEDSTERMRRYVLAPSKWDKKELTYRYLNFLSLLLDQGSLWYNVIALRSFSSIRL